MVYPVDVLLIGSKI